MVDFHSVLAVAQQLSEHDRLRLIDAIWDTLPEDSDLPLHPEWEAELERRLASIEAGSATFTPWEVIREEALRRLPRHDR
jgi:putative addiction module component (TIGR02574 family)